jgi:hypothetical protein
MTRPRAADDFGAIRERMEELRRERGQASPERAGRQLGPRPYHAAATQPRPGSARHFARVIRQRLFRQRLGKLSLPRISGRLGGAWV